MIDIGTSLGVDPSRVLCAIDFGNVNHWFQDKDSSVSLKKLSAFCREFSLDTRFYYGHNPQNPGSLAFLGRSRNAFGRSRVITKPIQIIKGLDNNPILKANFDVEIAVDAMAEQGNFDAFVLFSGDADFSYLLNTLRKKGKRTALLRGGYIAGSLKASADLVMGSWDIRDLIITRRPR